MNEEKEEILVTQDDSSGSSFTLAIDDVGMLGQNIKIYAYFGDKEKEAQIEVFCHYRFRYFDRTTLLDQVEERMHKPYKVDQGATSLCGMACLFYLFAKNHPEQYAIFAKEMHRKGSATYNGCKVEPDEDSQEEMYGLNPYTSPDHPNIPEVDWLTLAVTRNSESILATKESMARTFLRSIGLV